MKDNKSHEFETLIISILLIGGIFILFYPTISQTWNSYRESKLAQNTSLLYTKLSIGEKESDLNKATKYNQSLVGGIVPNVFAIREGQKDETYESTLNPSGSGIMGSISIPKINVEIPIYHYTSEEVLEKGCGHIFGSSLPVGGENTHTVLSAHRGLPSAKLFTDLDLIKELDHFYIKTLGETLAYQVDHIETVDPTDTKSLAIEAGKDYATLVTCTPYGINTKRLLVRGHRVQYSEKVAKKETNKITPKWTRILSRIVSVLMGLLLAYIIKKMGKQFSKEKHKKSKRKYR
ncbi:sortase A [Granulicatella balaenopterae]|uniref:Sortase A n=1 Tax=Granulicatella balaenopterae TaxID=137733 RepID=A0A1H9IA78_9LACT|nr:class C sortase [Granulicatella balaenopterae]SEQ71454.1 sortase A [Granulicatella balaenopterae]